MKKIAIAAFMLLMGITAFGQFQTAKGLPPIDLSKIVGWGHFLQNWEVDELRVEKKLQRITETEQTRFVEGRLWFEESRDSIVVVHELGVTVKPYSPPRKVREWNYLPVASRKALAFSCRGSPIPDLNLKN